jgi:hypothetical protein
MPVLSRLRPGAVLVVALLLAACASTPPTPVVDYNPGYDFASARTFAMYDGSQEAVGENPLRLSDMVRDRINLALQRALEAKGLVFVDDPESADLLLSWFLATEERTDVRTYETPSMGMYHAAYRPYNRYSMYSCWSCTNTEVRVSEYTLGTFVVDLIDEDLDKSVWRSVTTSKLKGKVERDQAKYDAAAQRILAEFPPGSAGE